METNKLDKYLIGTFLFAVIYIVGVYAAQAGLGIEPPAFLTPAALGMAALELLACAGIQIAKKASESAGVTEDELAAFLAGAGAILGDALDDAVADSLAAAGVEIPSSVDWEAAEE
ncbi:MAG: hypothetical protein LBR73_02480 [Oscillospiraceae bacterium]|nr:hypothetical protein [Oscillospiraceae bacterium]